MRTSRFSRKLPSSIKKLRRYVRKFEAHCNDYKTLSTPELKSLKKKADRIVIDQSVAMLRLSEVRDAIKYGKRVCVFFANPPKFYKGTVVPPNKGGAGNKVRVVFDDGDDLIIPKTELYNIPKPVKKKSA